jgi:N6-adenosine-specific RNA methylase IME4
MEGKMTTNNNQLVHFDKARQELELARNIDEVKLIRDQAEAMRQYIKQQKGSFEMQNQAAEIKLRAERRAGEMLKEQPKNKGQLYRGDIMSPREINPPQTLQELGITSKQSQRWQLEAEIPEEKFEQFIAETKEAADELTSHAALTIATRMKHESDRKGKVSQPLPVSIFNVIYADPPWKYNNSGFSDAPQHHYETMELFDIEALPINKLTAENCVLFLWTTNPFLKDALEVVDAWGFEYKTNFVWVKEHSTAGFYVRGQHELLLIATKGSLLPSGVMPISIINGSNDVHSKKPDCVYEIIESMFPGASKCELFARQKHEGWEAWGNDI